MKELCPASLPDGSLNFGNGIIGPSSLDVERANSTLVSKKPEIKEKPNNHSISVSQESIAGRLLQIMSKVKLPAKFVIPGSIAAMLIMNACSRGSGGEKNNTQELENKTSSGYSLPFPKGETWFLTGGPHTDGFSNGVRYAIDIAPPELGRLNGQCPTDGSKLVIENRAVTALASGEVIVAGDDKNRSDPSHSMIKIKDANGLTEVYVHAANLKVKKGDRVKQGAPLGNPSCEYPPGGRNEGAHIHVGLERDGQAIPIDGIEIGGWTIHDGTESYDGTMTKQGEKTRTANTGRYGENSNGIRNDLPNNSNRAVVAGPKSPIPPISGQITSKEISPKETWKTFKSPIHPYEIQYPASWMIESGKFTTDKLYDDSQNKDAFVVYIEASPIDPTTTLGSYVKDYIERRYRHNFLGLEPDEKLPELVTLIVKKGETAGLSSQTIQLDKPVADGYSLSSTLFIESRADGSRWLWTINHDSKPTVSKTDREFILSRLLNSFELTFSPTETKKPVVENKISLSKKPEDLYHTLTSAPLKKDLPSGMSVIGNPMAVSSSEIYNNMAKSFGGSLQPFSGGSIFISIDDERSNPVKGQGYPNISLTLTVFTNNQDAQATYNKSATQNEQTRPMTNFPYVAVIQGPINGMYSGTAYIENVVVGFTIRGNDMKVVEQRAIALMQTMPKLLQNAGN